MMRSLVDNQYVSSLEVATATHNRNIIGHAHEVANKNVLGTVGYMVKAPDSASLSKNDSAALRLDDGEGLDNGSRAKDDSAR